MSKEVWNWSIEEFLNQGASSAPTPGGGSISAYSGALGASMVCMVANLTLGKEKYREYETQIKDILSKGEQLLNELKAGLTQDIEEFSNFMDVIKMPKGTDEEKAIRSTKMQAVLKSATETPLNISRNCFEVLKLAKELAPIGNETAISDVGVAAYLAESSLKAAMLSVDINLPQIKDESYCQVIKEERERLIKESEKLKTETLDIVNQRL